jgi:hypothetical protein
VNVITEWTTAVIYINGMNAVDMKDGGWSRGDARRRARGALMAELNM